MSAPSPTEPSRPGHQRRASVGNMLKRFKTVLKRSKTNRDEPAQAEASTSAAEPATTAETPIEPATIEPDTTETETKTKPAEEAKPAEAKPVEVDDAKDTSEARPPYPRVQTQHERARALFEKYGLTLEVHEWESMPTTENIQRVQKPIRMRVHRNCHKCNTAFGPDKACPSCQHRRCQRCPRYPPKKDATSKGKEKADTKTTEGYVTQTKVQRVRRWCHKCKVEFSPPSQQVCSSCSHTRCTNCPRDPAKKNKYPYGYPGDAPGSDTEVERRVIRDRTYKKPRQRVRWYCEECNTLFVSGIKICVKCNHERCENCIRKPPKKAPKPGPDPEVVKSLEAKLAALAIKQE